MKAPHDSNRVWGIFRVQWLRQDAKRARGEVRTGATIPVASAGKKAVKDDLRMKEVYEVLRQKERKRLRCRDCKRKLTRCA